MYIKEKSANTYNVELNKDEFMVFRKVFDCLIFNKQTNVSNTFRLYDIEIEIVKSMNAYLYAQNRPKSISELRKQIAIKTVPGNGLVDLYKREK